MRVERASAPTDELYAALAVLVPQLSTRARVPTPDDLREVLSRDDTFLLVARAEDGSILGMLTLIVYRLPTGLRAMIHDVVVDTAARGRGAGEAMTREALRLAEEAGVESVRLTSRPEREAANRLYPRLGFQLLETNSYIWRPDNRG
jgi:ribosomal protein S18 acetylase RimI-like enzyme